MSTHRHGSHDRKKLFSWRPTSILPSWYFCRSLALTVLGLHSRIVGSDFVKLIPVTEVSPMTTGGHVALQKLQVSGRAINHCIDSGHWHYAPEARLSNPILIGTTVWLAWMILKNWHATSVASRNFSRLLAHWCSQISSGASVCTLSHEPLLGLFFFEGGYVSELASAAW